MTTRTSASLAALSLLAAGAIALRFAPATPAAVGLPSPEAPAPKPRVETVSVDQTELSEGRLRLAVRGENVNRYQVWATCPRGVRLEIGSANICSSRLARDEDRLESQAISIDAGTATGTVTITVKVDDPEVPTAPWTQKTVRVELAGE